MAVVAAGSWEATELLEQTGEEPDWRTNDANNRDGFSGSSETSLPFDARTHADRVQLPGHRGT